MLEANLSPIHSSWAWLTVSTTVPMTVGKRLGKRQLLRRRTARLAETPPPARQPSASRQNRNFIRAGRATPSGQAHVGWREGMGDRKALPGQTGPGATPGCPRSTWADLPESRSWGWLKDDTLPGVKRQRAGACCDLTLCGLEKTWTLPSWRRLAGSWPSVTCVSW